ncbi:uncharacterized protein EDB93DRAFT_1092909 [Suillus bovinus]|uniref:uncharacterized protein n=1 Tax=Suillus bovinus TaxID=48563 RepID=UPI001B85B738|nr:uncharacterized protein EDB93DRAFT_1092909 [Suillus bovinus]KAG2134167.1 hypothetical protein EDB93DRAFT_1092909 [Suillus bovinus]
MTSGPGSQWRTFPRNFHTGDQHQFTPGCINLAPCWFQQGREISTASPECSCSCRHSTLKGKGGPEVIISMQHAALLALAALQVMHPKLYWASVTTQMKLGQWAADHGLSYMCTCLQFWASVFNCAAVICNRQCPLH